MRLLAIGLMAAVAASPASAQWQGFGSTIGYQNLATITPPDHKIDMLAGVTPTMKRQRLQAADALRAEVKQMLANGNGRLTDDQVSYIRKSVQRINGGGA